MQADALLPQFASPEQGVAGVLLLGLLFCLLTFAWLAGRNPFQACPTRRLSWRRQR